MKERNEARPGLPPDARAEILEALCSNMEISSDEIVAILKRHHVAEDADVLQDRYRRQMGQRLMAHELRDRLVAMGPEQAQAFHDILHVYEGLADRYGLWDAANIMMEWCSDDGFIDFRAWLIAQGKEVYLSALKDPDTLADIEPYYNQAYYDIRRFMKEHGFEHRQSSAYVSAGRLTTLDIVILMERMAAELPWLGRCVNEIDVADIGAQHSLKKLLETASRPLEVELGELSMEAAAARPVRQKARSARRCTYARER